MRILITGTCAGAAVSNPVMNRVRFLLAALVVVLAGCGPARSYRIIRINGVPGIAPPVYHDGARHLKLTVTGVRSDAPGQCAIRSRDFRLDWAGQAAVVFIDLETLFPQGAYDEVAHGSFEAFRIQLETLEKRDGCLRPGGGRMIAQRIAESLPVPFQDVAFYRNRYNPYRTWVDLEPGMRLLRQSVVQDGNGSGSPSSVASEYKLLDRPDSAGVRFDSAPDGAPDLPFQRLFLRTTFNGERAAGSEQYATLVSAPDLRTMDEITAKFDENPAAVCDARPSPCTVFPNRVTMVPEIPVRARDTLVYVDPVSSVGDVLHRVYQKEPPKRAVETLTVERPFAGGYARIDLKRAGDLALRVPVVAGDRLHWDE